MNDGWLIRRSGNPDEICEIYTPGGGGTPPTDICYVQVQGAGILLTWQDNAGTEVVRNTAGWVATPAAGVLTYTDATGTVNDGWLIRRSGNPDEICEIYTPGGGGETTTTKFVHYYNHGGDTVAYNDDGTVTWMFTDQISSTSLTRTGTTNSIQRYTPWGETRTDGNLTTDHTFTGQIEDEATGLSFYNARYYDPAIGRFVSADTVIPSAGNGQDYNRYSYVRNNPVKYNDPTGNWCVWGVGTTCNDDSVVETTDEPEEVTPPPGPSRCRSDVIASFSCGFGAEGLDGANGMIDFFRTNPLDTVKGMDQTGKSCGTASSNSCLVWRIFQGTVQGLQEDTQENGYGSSAGRFTFIVGDLLLGGKGTGAADDAVRGASRVRHLCSFSGGTEVLMADDTTKPISLIEVGDMVWALDPETGEAGARVVSAVWPHEDLLLEFELDGGSLTTTEDHPFWNVTDGEWQESQFVDPGDYLLTADGDVIEAGTLDWNTVEAGEAYDLTVEGIHTYFVSTGDQEVLVHNCDLPTPNRVVNSYMVHAATQAVERAGYRSVGEASDALKTLSKSIQRSGFPSGTIADTRPNRWLVPIGDGGLAVYQLRSNGTAVLRTVLEVR